MNKVVTCHTRKWYKENYGVDPIKLGLPFKEVKNPHFSSASPMKLWKEEDVIQFKDEKGIEKHQKRSEAGRRAFRTRKEHLVEWFKQVKSENPRVNEIVKRLWEVGEEIGSLHCLKERCRNDTDCYDPKDYWDYGMEHCRKCHRMSIKQSKLREERERLFTELIHICNADKRTTQLARRYYRMERVGGDTNEEVEEKR